MCCMTYTIHNRCIECFIIGNRNPPGVLVLFCNGHKYEIFSVTANHGRGKPRDFFHSFRLGAKGSGRMPSFFLALKSWPGRNNVEQRRSTLSVSIGIIGSFQALNANLHCIRNEPTFWLWGKAGRKRRSDHLYPIQKESDYRTHCRSGPITGS